MILGRKSSTEQDRINLIQEIKAEEFSKEEKMNTMKSTVNPANKTNLAQLREQIISIETVQYGRYYTTLSYTIRKGEQIRVGTVPIHISILLHVHKEKKSQKYCWNSSIL